MDLRDGHVRFEVSGRRADVVLDDPDRHNPQNPATWRALAAIADHLDGQVDVVVIRGAGPSFSAGLDRSVLTSPDADGPAALATRDAAAAEAGIARYQDGFLTWAERPYLTIAAVRGHAIGAGLQLALACDLRIAADDAQLSMREPRLGLVPDLGGTARLVETIGYAKALLMCVTGQAVPATQALAWGLVEHVVPGAELGATVDALAAAVTDGPTDAVLATRRLLRRRRPDLADQPVDERRAQVERLRALAAARGLGASPHS